MALVTYGEAIRQAYEEEMKRDPDVFLIGEDVGRWGSLYRSSKGLLEQFGPVFKAYVLPNCSCEGLAEHLHGIFDPMVRQQTNDRVWITAVEIEEDSKNSAEYRPDC